MIHLNSRSVGKVRQEWVHGREYLVAPMTMIVSGVLVGNQGAIYYSAEENKRTAQEWNHMPVVIRHPHDDNGYPVSARCPMVLHNSKVGEVYNAHTTADGDLKGEAWIDVDLCEKVDRRVVNNLRAEIPLELSTGLFMKKEEAPENSVDKQGKTYSYIATNYKPDHLAILPDEVGACSMKDGCGVLINQTSDSVVETNALLSGVTAQRGLVWQLPDGGAPITNVSMSFDQIKCAIRELLCEKFPPYDVMGHAQPYVYLVDVYSDSFVYERGDELYRLGYSLSDAGVVTLATGEPTEVTKVVEYAAV